MGKLKFKINKVKLLELEAKYIPILYIMSLIFGMCFVATNY